MLSEKQREKWYNSMCLVEQGTFWHEISLNNKYKWGVGWGGGWQTDDVDTDDDTKMRGEKKND